MFARRSIAVALALSAFAAAAQEQPAAEPTAKEAAPASAPAAGGLPSGGGWDGQWGLLFGFNNILVVGSFLSDMSSPAGAVAGASYFLGPDLALRGGIRLSRATTSPTVAEQVTELGDERIVTRTHSRPSPTSTGQVLLSADVLKRLSDRAVAPYAGAGLFAAWTHAETNWRDDVTNPDVITHADDVSNGYSVGLQGALGAEWRFHPSFSVFAEYGLRLNVFTRVDDRDRRVDESPADQSRVTTSETSTRQEWLNFSSGLLWGGQLGLMVHFP